VQIILASASKYRRQLLQNIAIDARCIAADIDETPLSNESPKKIALRLAIAKAEAVASHENGVIIGSDQVASLDGQPLGKPGSIEKARLQLQRCSGQKVTFYTGLSVINSRTQHRHQCVESYSVFFRSLSETEIDRYLEIDQPFDCAGSFKAEGVGISLFEKLEGDDPNTLIGLPLIKLCEFLRAEGIAIP